MTFTKTTEQSSKHEHLEKMSVQELLFNINQEDQTVPLAVAKALPSIEALVTQIVAKEKIFAKFLKHPNSCQLPCYFLYFSHKFLIAGTFQTNE